ncbi:hypothetical protein SMG44B_50327 [Stenotrophomonas maltophilia]|nr:hypothetical protein BN1263580002 [Stenotrophomonas maltophilia]
MTLANTVGPTIRVFSAKSDSRGVHGLAPPARRGKGWQPVEANPESPFRIFLPYTG